MFDAVRNNKRIVQIFLALITLPFAFFGIDSYMRSSHVGDDVARVGGTKISQPQFQQALREQQERLRSQLGDKADPKLLDKPEIRKAILDNMINQRLLLLEASKGRMAVSDEAIREAIGGIDAFKLDGKFNSERYESALRAQGMTPAGFEAQLRQDLTLRQLAGTVEQTGIAARAVSDRVTAMQTENRIVREFKIGFASYLDKAKLADGAAKKFYDENQDRFKTPEAAKAEYVVLSMDAIGAQLTVSDADVNDWYQSHQKQYESAEERRVSHILIAPDKAAKDHAKADAAAKARAEALLAEVRKNPDSFAELAKKNSEDPGSAAKGGDLGYFGRGMMDKSFEDAAFKLKEGEISGVVKSDFGYHIIKLTGIHAAKVKPLAEVRNDIVTELKNAAASRKFAEAAEAFSNIVYEQPDSLKPAAEKFKLTIQQTGWLGRQPNPANGPLANEKLLKALFSDDAVKDKHNTDAIETAPNTLVAARIVDYKPAALQSFDSVKAGIETMLKRQEAEAMARKDGESLLAALKKGEDNLAWGDAKTISRMDAHELEHDAAAVAFKLDTSRLPAYGGTELPGEGYALLKLDKVEPGKALDNATKETLRAKLASVGSQEEVLAYLAALRARYKVEINEKMLAAKDQ